MTGRCVTPAHAALCPGAVAPRHPMGPSPPGPGREGSPRERHPEALLGGKVPPHSQTGTKRPLVTCPHCSIAEMERW